MMTRWTIAMTGALLASLSWGCGDSETGSRTVVGVPELQVTVGSATIGDGGGFGVTLSDVAPGETGIVESMRIENVGDALLTIDSISLVSDPPGAFSLGMDGGALPSGALNVDWLSNLDSSDHPKTLWLDLLVTRTDFDKSPTARLVIQSNSTSGGGLDREYVADISLGGTAPRIQVSPQQVDLGPVGLDDSGQRTVTLLNQGTDDLFVDSFVLSGHPGFAVVIDGVTWPVSVETSSTGVTLDEPLVVLSGETAKFVVLFTPTGPEEAKATLVLFSNDPTAGQGTVVPLQANVGGPCIAVSPRVLVDFGGKLIGRAASNQVEITSCGDAPLEISEIFLDPESSGDFSLALETLPGVSSVTPVTAIGPNDAPVILQPNQTAVFNVVYVPDEENPLDGSGAPIPDLGLITIRSNSFVGDWPLDIRGFGVTVECPTARIIVQEGEEVIPQTRLHLIGSQSYAATGAIEEFKWEVQAPLGSQSVFLPSDSVADPTFEVNVAGTYIFHLSVKDSSGEESCFVGEATVIVNPDEAIHIELLWDTPNDADQTDEGPIAGADMDLHFLHPFATGLDVDEDGELDGWFDVPYDAFWANKNPNWASIDEAIDDNPGLDRDDTDGAGPENLNLNLPEDGSAYRLGVHYWNDHGFGVSFATVRIYIFSNLVWELSEVELVKHDMWCVASIQWPSTEITSCTVCEGTSDPCSSNAECGGGTCGLNIVPNYVHPFYPTD